MNLASNYIGNITPANLNGLTQNPIQDFDLDDRSFDDILTKQMELPQNSVNTISNNIQIPSGIDIGDFDGHDIIKTEATTQPRTDFSNIKDMTTSEVVTFMSSLFDTKPTFTQNGDNGLFNFERKLAATSYGKYAKGLVTDLQDFVSDALKLS